MKADDARRESSFVYWYKPKAKQDVVDGQLNREYAGAINPGHTVITFIGPMADVLWDRGSEGMQYDLYDENGELRRSDQSLVPLHENSQRIVVTREWLLKLLEPMTSDYVIIEAAENYPVRVIGEIGERKAAALIASRVEN